MDSVAGLASGANLEGVIRIEEEKIRSQVGEVVRESVEQTLNGLLQAAGDSVERSQSCQSMRRVEVRARADL